MAAVRRRELSRKPSGAVYERALLKAQLQASPDGVLVVDPKGRILSYNRRFVELWGIPAEVLASRDDTRALGSVLDRLAQPQAFLERVERIYSRPDDSSQDEVRLKDGRVFERQSAPVIGERGERYGRVWHFRDITDRKLAESAAEETRRTHESYVRAVEGSTDGLWDWDVGTNEVYFSPRYKTMLGYGVDEMANTFEAWVSLIHPDDRAVALEKVKAYQAGSIPVYELEHRLLQKDGSYRWVLARGAALRDASGRLIRMSGSHTDIDARKRAHEALRESERRFREVTENIREAFWLAEARADGGGDVIYVSPMWSQIWGKPLSVATVRNDWAAALHPDDRDRVLAHIAVRPWRSYEHQYRIVRPDGEVRWVRDRAFPIKDADGKVTRVAGVSEDVTDRHRLEMELLAARDEALASANAKSEFLANVSHELRTPLNAVIGMNELLLESPLTEPQRERAAIARDAGRGLLGLIDDLLDFSRLEAGQLKLDDEPFDPRELVAGVERMFHDKAAEKSLRLSSRVEANVPSSLLGDAARLRQVLVNFAGNALKFTERGGVEIAAALAGRRLRLTVTDSGPGIRAEVRERLFTAFMQGDASVTRRHGGTGLGLAICRQIAEFMGGEIGVESEPGRGSTFYFEAFFPPAPEEARQPPGAPARRADVRGLRVLVVEDNAVNRRVTLQQLEQLGCRTDTAEDGALALAALERGSYDAVLMDCAMPRMDGYAAVAELRRREGGGRHIPVIALTAGAAAEDKARCLAAGMDDHLAKPVSLDALAASLSRWGGPLDPAVLQEAMSLVEDAERWREAYLADARRLIGEIAHACVAGDEEKVRLAAHTLKGASAALGARRLAALCAGIESGLAPDLGELETELDLLARRLAS